MVLPPAPQKVSMRIDLVAGAQAARSAAMRVATGSGVTPNQAESVIQMPEE